MTPNRTQSLFAVSLCVASFALALTPIVASAKRSSNGPTTLDSLKRIGLAAVQYASDYDGGVVLTQQGDAGFDRTWPVLLWPYLPEQKAFFDPMHPMCTTPTASLAGLILPWSSVTTLSINDSGYSGSWITTTKTCTGKRSLYKYGQRNLNTMDDPDKRVAFAPTTYGGMKWGWSFFLAYQSNWIRPSVSRSTFSWNNMIYYTFVPKDKKDTTKIPTVHADGSAGLLTDADFKSYTEKTSALATTAYCSWLSTTGKSTWGAFWDTH